MVHAGDPVTPGRVRRLLAEPLLHFFILGAALFGLFGLLGRPFGDRRQRIVVTPGQIEHLANTFARTWQRPPASLELDALIDDHIRDEVYAREAMALGLDRDDVVVRRRLRQKMEFLTEEAGATTPPSDDELAAFLAAHAERYRVEPRLAFRQVFLSADRRGERAEADARAALARLAGAGPDADVSTLGDPLLLPDDVPLSSLSEIARLFGEPFSARLLETEPGRWVGPIESGYGVHVVYVRQREGGRTPALSEVRDAVLRDWEAEQRKAMLEAAYRKLLDHYAVTVERPRPGDRMAAR
jgi:hypothetical protein